MRTDRVKNRHTATIVAVVAMVGIAIGLVALSRAGAPRMRPAADAAPTAPALSKTAAPASVAPTGSIAVTLTVVSATGLPGRNIAGFNYFLDQTPAPVSALGKVSDVALASCATSLSTPTFDGSGQACHPSVIDFLTQYHLRQWGGYRYWMAMTPYPGANARYEDPSLLVSNDGLTWSPPGHGIASPMVKLATNSNYNPVHYSDPDLVYDPKAKTLDLFYRENYGAQSNAAEGIHRVDVAVSAGGYRLLWHKNLSSPLSIRDVECLSPGVVIGPNRTWHMWFVSYPTGGSVDGTGTLAVMHCTSSDGLHWGSARACTPPSGLGASRGRLAQPAVYPWHLEARRDGAGVDLLICSTVSKARPSDTVGSALYLAQSTFGRPTTLTYPLAGPLMDPVTGTGLYRATLVPGATFQIWYSIRDARSLKLRRWVPIGGAPTSQWTKEVWDIGHATGRVVGSQFFRDLPTTRVPVRVPSSGNWFLHIRGYDDHGGHSAWQTVAIRALPGLRVSPRAPRVVVNETSAWLP